MRFGSWMLSGVLREEAKEGEPGGGAPPADKGAAAEPAVDPKALQAEIDRLKTEATEARNAAQYWHEQVKGKQPPESKPKATPKAEEPDEEDLIEVVSKKGAKGVAEYLKRQGFISADEVESKIESRAQQLVAETQIQAEYPELKEGTEFFKEAAPRYKALTDQGVPHTIALRLAAQQTELDGFKSGKRLTPKEKEEREARARAQAPDKGKKNAAAEPEQEEDLSDFQKTICDRMGISYDAYKAQAKKGPVYRFE